MAYMKPIKYVWALLLLTATSVANASDMDVSAELVRSYCSDYFGMVNVEFENNSDEWIDIEEIGVSLGSKEIDDKVTTVVGNRLVNWNDAISDKLKSDAFYRRLFLGTLTSIGALAARDSGNEFGKAVALGSMGALTLSEISSAIDDAGTASIVPRTHLMHGLISVPPGLSLNRWILFNTKADDGIPLVTHITLNLKVNGASEVSKNIYLRSHDRYMCKWQSYLFEDRDQSESEW